MAMRWCAASNTERVLQHAVRRLEPKVVTWSGFILEGEAPECPPLYVVGERDALRLFRNDDSHLQQLHIPSVAHTPEGTMYAEMGAIGDLSTFHAVANQDVLSDARAAAFIAEVGKYVRLGRRAMLPALEKIRSAQPSVHLHSVFPRYEE